MKKECIDHIYDKEGYCEWKRESVTVRQDFSECEVCGNGKASEVKEM